VTEESLSLAALQRTDPADRWAFLDPACAGGVELPRHRRKVEELIEGQKDEPRK
jgi:hypothetical protein